MAFSTKNKGTPPLTRQCSGVFHVRIPVVSPGTLAPLGLGPWRTRPLQAVAFCHTRGRLTTPQSLEDVEKRVIAELFIPATQKKELAIAIRG